MTGPAESQMASWIQDEYEHRAQTMVRCKVDGRLVQKQQVGPSEGCLGKIEVLIMDY